MTTKLSGLDNSVARAVFGAGCFWGSEAAFRRLSGVVDTRVGFMGDSRSGQVVPVSDVHAHELRHVEVVVVDFDPTRIDYGDLLEAFWKCHDSSVPAYDENGKPDLVRSVIFAADDDQMSTAQDALAAMPGTAVINTVVEQVGHFHMAREDQQRYLEKNEQAVCSMKTSLADAAE